MNQLWNVMLIFEEIYIQIQYYQVYGWIYVGYIICMDGHGGCGGYGRGCCGWYGYEG